MRKRKPKVGGYRPGAGRPPVLSASGPTVTKAVRLPASVAKKIEATGESFSDFVRKLLADNGYGES